MSLSKHVIETLIDLVEIKLSCVEIYDREDKREVAGLERARQELQTLLEQGRKARGRAAVVAFRQASQAKGGRRAVAGA